MVKRIIRKFIYDTRLSHKLFYVILVMILIPMACIGILFYQRLANVIKEEIGSSYEQIVKQYADNIQYKLTTYQNLMDNIIMNGTVQKIFSNQDNSTASDTIAIGGEITNEIVWLTNGKNMGEVDSLRLYAYNESFPSDGRYISNLGTVKNEPWYGELLESVNTSQYFIYTSEGLKKQVISFTKPIINLKGRSFQEKLGFVKLDVDAEKLFGIQGLPAGVHCDYAALFSRDGRVITSSAAAGPMPTGLWNLYRPGGSGGWHGLVNDAGRKQIVVYESIDKYGWVVFFVFPYSQIDEKVKDSVYPVLILGAALLVVLIGLSILFTYFLSGRIRRLTAKMDKVESGNLEITETIEGKDEIGTLDDRFNRMVDRLKNLIDENYIQKLERREAEMNALQAQINPHFLYNTLEAVNSIASLNGCEDICTISQNLGDMFRYTITIGRNEFVRLQDELTHVRNYLSIQAIRYGNSFEIAYGIPDELLHCRVLKFILQPIVENAFIHGFKGGKRGGVLSISAAKGAGALELYVEDNGKGMSPARLAEIEAAIHERGNGGGAGNASIGVRNVHSRIRLTYGENYGLSFQSGEGVGTKVTIRLPYSL